MFKKLFISSLALILSTSVYAFTTCPASYEAHNFDYVQSTQTGSFPMECYYQNVPKPGFSQTYSMPMYGTWKQVGSSKVWICNESAAACQVSPSAPPKN